MHKPVSHAWQGPESSFAFILPSFVHQPYRATRNGCLQMDPDGVIGALLININKVETSSFWAARRETDPHDPSHTLDVTHSTRGQIHQHREVTVRHLQIAPKLHRWMDSWLPLLLLGPDYSQYHALPFTLCFYPSVSRVKLLRKEHGNEILYEKRGSYPKMNKIR
ncbi:hypothetical protein, variant 1 [Blastomyces gilchristii SLH14081]|uniref:Uncharacterized protein n=1 Tax=Blastomyces gilchristii (strain SLH14081) TaxID=559298 RepID=A0A179UKJ7_BLAGS|nr:hypothetical protein, variant 1 [Blastomyces gilchristii SLH14081]OAT06932.1 hypothetical protein, variant 1 [Blastomyces gilchristii SLH14081]